MKSQKKLSLLILFYEKLRKHKTKETIKDAAKKTNKND